MPSNLDNVLFDIATSIMEKATERAKAYAPNTHIKDAIFSSMDRIGDGEYLITLEVSTPDAAAYEFGSGIHSTEGVAEPYTISPRNAKMLAFFWDKAHENIPKLPDGRVILASVQHPGVAPANGGRGYMRPAITDTISEISQFADEITQSIIDDIKTSWDVNSQ